MRSGGRRGVKHAGLAQRVTKRAARIEALVLADRTAGLVPVLEEVYRSLGKPFRAGCVGDVAGRDAVAAALAAEVASRYDLVETPMTDELLTRAVEQRGSWRAKAK